MSLTGKSRRFSSSAKEVPAAFGRHCGLVRDDIHVIFEVVLLEQGFLLLLGSYSEDELAAELVLNDGRVEGQHFLNSEALVEHVVKAREGENDGDQIVLGVGLGVEEFRFAADGMEKRVRDPARDDEWEATHVTVSSPLWPLRFVIVISTPTWQRCTTFSVSARSSAPAVTTNLTSCSTKR